MSRTSCISHPGNDPLIIIHRWQLEFCTDEGGKVNECAAALLSYFEYWHSLKVEVKERHKTANDAYQREEKGRPLSESLLQWHSTAEIESGLLIFKRSSIQTAIDFLVKKGAVEVRRNPVLKYDNTKHFLFHPEILNKWLEIYVPNSVEPSAENSRPLTENGKSSTENSRTIPEITSEITSEITPEHAHARVNGAKAPEQAGGPSEPEKKKELNGQAKTKRPAVIKPPDPPLIIPLLLQKDEKFLEAYADFDAYRQDMTRRWPWTRIAQKLTLQQCEKLGVDAAIEGIQFAIRTGIRGIPEKPANRTNKYQNNPTREEEDAAAKQHKQRL